MALWSVSTSSAALRQNIEYGRAGDVSLRMDAHVPEGAGPFPAVVIVHGGGWVSGDRKWNVEPLFAPLAQAGFAWFSIDYRLVQDPLGFGAAIEDVTQAVRYVKEHAAEYHVDPDRVALVGESAGAHLAAMAALRGEPDTAVRGVVAFYCPSDLVALAKTSPYIPAEWRARVKGTPWEQLLLTGLQQLSPLAHVQKDMPPFLLIHGTEDRLVPFAQSQVFCDRMKSAGASCTLYPVAGMGHGVRWWNHGKVEASYQKEMVNWLQEQLRPVVAAR